MSEKSNFNWLIKVRHSPSINICFICFNEISLKMMENAFYFILIVLFFLKTFFSQLFGNVGKKIAIHILPSISRSKGNQTTALGQLIEYNKINIFLQKLCKKCGKEASSRSVFVFFLIKLYRR